MDVNSRPEGDRRWLVYLLIGLTFVGIYFLIPTDDSGRIARFVVYCLITSSAAVVALWGVRRNRPRPALPWLLIALGQVVYAVADISFYVAHYVLRDHSYPNVADIFYLGHYPLVVAGLVLLIRMRTPGRDTPGILDAAVLSVSAGMMSWLYLIGPRAQQDSPLLVKAASLAYPMMDLAMLAVALRLIMGGGRRPAAFWLLSTNLIALFAADSIYVLQQLDGTYAAGNFLDAIWLVSNLALGAAALNPTMAQLGDRSEQDTDTGPSLVRMAVLSAAALLAPVVLFVQSSHDDMSGVPVIAVACALLFGLTIARLAGLVATQRRLAITDMLTGLYTRRFFEAHLPLEIARAKRGEGHLAVFIVDVDHFKSINDRYGHPAGDSVLVEIAQRLRGTARAGDVVARYGGEEFALLVPDAAPSELPAIAERLRHCVASSPITVGADSWIAVTVSVGTASYPMHGEEPSALVAVADRALYAAKEQGRDRIVVGRIPESAPGRVADHTAMVDYLRHVADEVDAQLAGQEHSRAISRWAREVAEEMSLGPEAAHQAGLGGRLHDIGKIVLPTEVLTKPGRLDEAEWALMRQHPDHGYRLAAMVPDFTSIAEIIRQHHERYDGTGYPRGLAGDAIRVEARIVAVCDAWAAMLSDRPYQRSLGEKHAVAELRACSGSQFDPAVVDAFLKLQKRGAVGTLRAIRPATRQSRNQKARKA
ncbi:diguanylate cyclase (GGDEF)-like protein [Crossiella equi]|uniref:Diguanylate cyclase (GGDEF)-like protein n=1 Tax=Crossiella equi TaxID=130796 RepID=A0ABS5A893_9PSEU|nr:diguanylate cyclase [Crossiella equi]MBP2472497.1 diguanylate cyclase (GGDEF)-like protein [Crossiella equi]